MGVGEEEEKKTCEETLGPKTEVGQAQMLQVAMVTQTVRHPTRSGTR